MIAARLPACCPESPTRPGTAALAAARAPGHEPDDDDDGHGDQPDDEKRLERCNDAAHRREGKRDGDDRATIVPMIRRMSPLCPRAPAQATVALAGDFLLSLLNAAQVKLGGENARLLIDVTAVAHEHVRPLPTRQIDQLLRQLRLSQVSAEAARASKASRRRTTSTGHPAQLDRRLRSAMLPPRHVTRDGMAPRTGRVATRDRISCGYCRRGWGVYFVLALGMFPRLGWSSCSASSP